MLYLASRSPRRKELLQRLDVPFQLLDLEVPELHAPGESAAEYVQRVARDKALAGLLQVAAHDPQAVVLGSDTEVVLDDRVFGKPADAADAAAMLAALSARTHQVITTVVLAAQGREPLTDTVVSQVSFAALSSEQIDAYVASGEPLGKAGGYAIQGRGERLIIHLDGSHSAVMGLPLYQTAQLLAAYGVN
jgi:septum formation protein